MEELIRKEVVSFISGNPANQMPDGDSPYFDEPLVGFSSAADPIFASYTRSIGPFHLLPAELLPEACGKPVFLLNLPATWQTRPARDLYLSELRRLGTFLESLGGLPVDSARLADVMRDFDHRRGLLRQTHGRVPAREFSTALQEYPFHRTPAPGGPIAGVPLGLVGGELVEEDLAILDAIEAAGGRIALDATDGGLRGLPAPFDPSALAADPLAELARAYFDTIPHAFRRPDLALHEYLARAVAELGLRGLIFRRTPWCDLWNAQAWRIRQSLSVPVLDLDMGGPAGATARTRGRIEAFMEMLCHPIARP